MPTAAAEFAFADRGVMAVRSMLKTRKVLRQEPRGLETLLAVCASLDSARGAVLIKCQRYFQGILYDYVAPPIDAATLPASRNAYWIYDAWVDTQGRDVLPNVPKCVGFNRSF